MLNARVKALLQTPITARHLKKAGKTVLDILILLLAFAGIASVLDYAIGDGPLPAYRSLQAHAPELMDGRWKNATLGWEQALAPLSSEEYWQGLQPSLAILRAINPEVGGWLQRMHDEDRLRYSLLPLKQYVYAGQTYLAADTNRNVLRIAPPFWRLTDGEKAAHLAHEYRHFRQNRAKILSHIVAKILSGKFREYGSPLEDEAFLYQAEAYRALGMPINTIAPYLQRRNLLHYAPLVSGDRTCQHKP